MFGSIIILYINRISTHVGIVQHNVHDRIKSRQIIIIMTD